MGSLSGAQNVDLASKFQLLLGLGKGDRKSGPYVKFIPIGWFSMGVLRVSTRSEVWSQEYTMEMN